MSLTLYALNKKSPMPTWDIPAGMMPYLGKINHDTGLLCFQEGLGVLFPNEFAELLYRIPEILTRQQTYQEAFKLKRIIERFPDILVNLNKSRLFSRGTEVWSDNDIKEYVKDWHFFLEHCEGYKTI